MKKCFLGVLLCFCSCQTLLAHRLTCFATVVDNEIHGRVYYPNGNFPNAAEVKLFDVNGDLLKQTEIDQDGNFKFPLPDIGGQVSVSVFASDGHSARRNLVLPETEIKIAEVNKDLNNLERLEEQIIQLRYEVDEMKNQHKIQDLLGGAGYLLGLFGLIFYLRAKSLYRSEKNNDQN